MRDQRYLEIGLLAVVALVVATGGARLIALLHRSPTLGATLAAGGIVAALVALRGAYRPDRDDARIAATKYGAYLCGAVLGFWAVLAPARWNVGATVAALVVAIAFDIITVVTRPRVEGA